MNKIIQNHRKQRRNLTRVCGVTLTAQEGEKKTKSIKVTRNKQRTSLDLVRVCGASVTPSIFKKQKKQRPWLDLVRVCGTSMTALDVFVVVKTVSGLLAVEHFEHHFASMSGVHTEQHKKKHYSYARICHHLFTIRA